MCKKEQCGENPSTIAELDPVKQKFICVRRGKQHYHEVRLFGGPGGLLGMLNLQQSNTHFRRKGHFSLWHCERTDAELLRLNVVFFFLHPRPAQFTSLHYSHSVCCHSLLSHLMKC